MARHLHQQLSAQSTPTSTGQRRSCSANQRISSMLRNPASTATNQCQGCTTTRRSQRPPSWPWRTERQLVNDEKQRIHRETTATTIGDATPQLTQTGTNVCREHITVIAKHSQTVPIGRPSCPIPFPTPTTPRCPIPPASTTSRCPPRVVSTGSITVADRLPHLDHRPYPPVLLLSPRCSHWRDHSFLHHRHVIIDATQGDTLTATYEGTTATITTTGAKATAIGSHIQAPTSFVSCTPPPHNRIISKIR